jgi:alpha-glucosidase
MKFTCMLSPDGKSLRIDVGRHEGSYPAWWRQVAVEVDGLSGLPPSVTINGHAATIHAGDRGVTVTADDEGSGLSILVPLDAQPAR